MFRGGPQTVKGSDIETWKPGERPDVFRVKVPDWYRPQHNHR